MKISEQWLRSWVNPNNDTQALANQLTMAGLEIDDIASVAAEFSGVVVGEVIDIQQHPDADKLRVTKVNIGSTSEPLQIICGAPNVHVGMKAPVATIGAKLPTEDGKGFKIKKSKLRGIESQGMLCGASEIDLPDVVDGLFELPDDAPIGTDIREYLGLDNKILDISITPNRGDCFSVRGIAREIGVLNGMAIAAPDITAQAGEVDATQDVVVKASDACPRYLAQPVMNIDRSVETPDWIQKSLLHSGQRLHNFLVDVTNYVLLELGQPIHAFDADKVVGAITVRIANKGEQLELLNEQNITLHGDELVIADDEGILALAGIMGGLRSSVTNDTKNIVLESAFFDPIAIAGRARRFGLHTDASQRFERGVDFELPSTALNRAVNLISRVTKGQAGNITVIESIEQLPKRPAVKLPLLKVAEVIGIDIEKKRIIDILTQLEIEVNEIEQDGNVVLNCRPPSHRFDIEIKEDLIEEIARIYGYDNIPSTLPNLGVDMSYDDSADLTYRLKLAMVEAGYMEAISFSFSDEKYENILSDDALGNLLPLANPISADLAVMRRTLLSSLIPCVQHNLNRQQTRVRFFETGLSFVGATVSELVQTPSIAIVATGEVNPEQAHSNRLMDFYDLKRDVEQLFPNNIDDSELTYERSTLAFLHPGQSATLLLHGVVVGWMGQLHPSVSAQLDLPTAWVAQLALEPIFSVNRAESEINTPSKFPLVRRDIALLVDKDIPKQDLSITISKAGGSLLQHHWLFDVYQGKNTPEGVRSVAFGLIWQDANQTLSDDIVNAAVDKVIKALHDEHCATLRDS